MASCPRCDTPVGSRQRFCTNCGWELTLTRGPAAGDGPTTVGTDVGLVACPHCGATNAASRRRCGRCERDLQAAPPAADRPRPGPPAAADERPETSGLLILTTLVAAVATGAVVLTILSARGIGPLAQRTAPESTPAILTALEITAAQASGTAVADLVDGDPRTAWRTSAAGEPAVTLRLAERAAVSRLVVWNGHQRENRFDTTGRVGRLRIEAGQRSFTVQLLDRDGPQAVDLPESVVTDRLRLVILELFAGDYSEAALSEVEVYAED